MAFLGNYIFIFNYQSLVVLLVVVVVEGGGQGDADLNAAGALLIHLLQFQDFTLTRFVPIYYQANPGIRLLGSKKHKVSFLL